MKKPGVLLVNLGSPDSPTVPAVRRYLREFLMDPRVMDLPWPLRALIVNAFILPSRPKRSAEAYQKVWTPEGAPLVAISRRVQCKLQQRLGLDLPVEVAMRYQNPSIASALANLRMQGVETLLVIPMFPHYAMSSYETAVVRVKKLAARIAPGMELQVVPPYFDDPLYIQALVASASDALAAGYDHLLFSFHGLPERHLHKADPTGCRCLKTPDCCERPGPVPPECYRAQCLATVRAFATAAGIPGSRHSVAFQSRLGVDAWLKPSTEAELTRLAQAGVKKLVVICPAFVSDCLETLEEIAIRGQEIFLAAGGESLSVIPCLNDHPQWLCALESIVRRHL